MNEIVIISRTCYSFLFISIFSRFVTLSELSFNAMSITFASVVYSN